MYYKVSILSKSKRKFIFKISSYLRCSARYSQPDSVSDGAQTRYLKPLSPSSLSLLNHLRLYIPEATQRLTNKWRPSCLDFLFQFLILMIQILAIEVIILRWIDTRGWRSQKQILQSRKDAQLYHLCQKIKLNREKIIF